MCILEIFLLTAFRHLVYPAVLKNPAKVQCQVVQDYDLFFWLMEVSIVSDTRQTSHLMLSRLSTRAQTNEQAGVRLHVPASYLSSWKDTTWGGRAQPETGRASPQEPANSELVLRWGRWKCSRRGRNVVLVKMQVRICPQITKCKNKEKLLLSGCNGIRAKPLGRSNI